MPFERDVAAFEARARTFDHGWLGRLHHDIADRAAVLAVSSCPHARRILDVGCGTGYLLGNLAGRYPRAIELAGVDPAPGMVEVAIAGADDNRIALSLGDAEQLPYPDEAFDLVVTTTSFDHWQNQPAGLHECARVLQSGGVLVIVDLFSPLLLPTLLAGRRDKARTKRRCEALLRAAGFSAPTWHRPYAAIINAVTATV